MEFLDNPTVQFALMCIALVMLGQWILSGVRRYKGPPPERAKELNSLIEQLNDQERAEVKACLAGKRKLEAIKYFRATTNVGLRDAKDAVEWMEDEEKTTA